MVKLNHTLRSLGNLLDRLNDTLERLNTTLTVVNDSLQSLSRAIEEQKEWQQSIDCRLTALSDETAELAERRRLTA